MYAVHFMEKNIIVLTQVLRDIPAVEDNLKIKGRKGKVISVQETEENGIHVQVEFEQIVDKNKAATKELGKKKRK
ncbi:hypothetical protein SAMN04487786_1294 [Paenisporosarcina quisquiliarum]|uniref:hypothetical protein n=1 Tax=Psychrobacillus TaxID=1221880 RepID=UPI0008AB7D92|nr:hypothetical protein [Psychrobacillus psychrodurans]MCZ8539622.1 hypothetical protein [Psychrobacillus psychrodurans]SEM18981.1 hypothetical protein SAMN04487786_1294 [Paenisporosarcina quisquiliarum]SFM43001.1 hypothetical protein SAMN05421832_102462 [Psychrobacillus psychrodurans]